MNNKIIIPISIIVVIVLLLLGISFFMFNSSDRESSFSEDGNLTKDEPGLKAGVWYLFYSNDTSGNTLKELDLTGVDTKNLRKLQAVHVEGEIVNDVIKVSSIVISSANKDDLIWVLDPLPNQKVTSPLTVSGEARGNWYFEASFPVKLLDANGSILAQEPAQAQGEWMTTEYVPFEVTLTFPKPSTSTGTLVLEKDNPSGLPEHANELRIPVSFETSGRAVSLYYYNANEDKDASGNILCSDRGIVPVQRQIAASNTPIQDTINLLLKGELTHEEKNEGISTEYPLPGLQLKGANLANGTLTLEFADPQNKTVGGSCRVSILWKQIEATAKQFSEVKNVAFKPDSLFQP